MPKQETSPPQGNNLTTMTRSEQGSKPHKLSSNLKHNHSFWTKARKLLMKDQKVSRRCGASSKRKHWGESAPGCSIVFKNENKICLKWGENHQISLNRSRLKHLKNECSKEFQQKKLNEFNSGTHWIYSTTDRMIKSPVTQLYTWTSLQEWAHKRKVSFLLTK
jgi:hypothetical protein